MKLYSIAGNSLKLDGGAMFGNVPRNLWQRWLPPDDQNRIDLATRALLAVTENHKILFETGIGIFMKPELQERYGVQEDYHVLESSLISLGIHPDDITDVVLSHLHFDHGGGILTQWQENAEQELLFQNAKIYVSSDQWNRANDPHSRDRASFSVLLNEKLNACSSLVTVKGGDILSFDELEMKCLLSDGHTPGMICSDLRWGASRLVFAADLIPGTPWVHLPVTMGYDRFPEKLIEEKKELLDSIVGDNGWIFYTHDPLVSLSKVAFDRDKNRYIVTDEKEILSGDIL